MFSHHHDRIIVKHRKFSLLEIHEKNILRINEYQFPIEGTLPALITDHDQIEMRALTDIIGRILALMVVAVKGEGLIQEDVYATMTQLGAEAFLTEEEKEFVHCVNPSSESLMFFTARHEAVDTLLWSIGYKNKLLEPFQGCPVMTNKLIIRDHYQNLGNQISRISPQQIVEQADFYHKLGHIIGRMIQDHYKIDGIYIGAVFERINALAWLVLNRSWEQTPAQIDFS